MHRLYQECTKRSGGDRNFCLLLQETACRAWWLVFFFLNFLTATSEVCFLWVFGAGELTLLILSASAGKLLEHFWVCFLGCVPATLLLQRHTGKEMEGEHTPEAELCSETAPLPTSLLLAREANAPSASPREERCCRQPQPDSEMLLGRRYPAKTSSALNKKLPSLCSQHIIPLHKHLGMPASLLLLFSIAFSEHKGYFLR